MKDMLLPLLTHFVLSVLAGPSALPGLCALGSSLTVPALTHSNCEAPSILIRPSPSSALAEQLQATVTAQEAKFLSFEEWKAQNLVGGRESRPHTVSVGPLRTAHGSSEAERCAQETQLTLDSTGTVQVSTDTLEPQTTGRQGTTKETVVPSTDPEESGPAVKKDRFNHASFDCAASIVQANKESKGSSNILKENKDYYMLNTCTAPSKFVIIELCNDILVDTVQLANYEFFSGVFRDVRIFVAAKYPPGREGWQELGQIQARHVRSIQTFHFGNPLIWTKYVKVEMLNFYGNEFYCPLSQVRVFGKTMMEDYKQEGASEADAGDGLEGLPVIEIDSSSREMLQNVERAAEGLVALSDKLADDMQKNELTDSERPVSVEVEIMKTMATAAQGRSPETITPEARHQESDTLKSVCVPKSSPNVFMHALKSPADTSRVPQFADVEQSLSMTSTSPAQTVTIEDVEILHQTRESSTSSHVEVSVAKVSSSSSTPSLIGVENAGENRSSTNRGPIPTPPSTQESIYKQISKRLSLLEMNATLSLRYIESQSALLAQSFSQLSTTQARHLANFLENVNVTMVQRISHLKQEYEQLFAESTRSAGATRRRQEKDMAFVTRKLLALSDDIIFFKRLGMFQSVLMVVLLGFLVTSRGPGVEVQHSLHRAFSRKGRASGESPGIRAGSPLSWRHHFRGHSTLDESIYSFPVDQIDRPEQSTPQSPLSEGGDYGAGLGISINRSSNPFDTIPQTDSTSRARSPLVDPTQSMTRDDMYHQDLNSAIRRRLYRDASWTPGSTEDISQAQSHHALADQGEDALETAQLVSTVTTPKQTKPMRFLSSPSSSAEVTGHHEGEVVEMYLAEPLEPSDLGGAEDYPTPKPEDEDDR